MFKRGECGCVRLVLMLMLQPFQLGGLTDGQLVSAPRCSNAVSVRVGVCLVIDLDVS